MRNKLNVALLLLSMVISLQTWAANYYVAATGGSDSNNGSFGAPFATLSKALTKAVNAGDTIFVRSGTYTVLNPIRITKSGNAVKHLVLTAYKPDLIDANSRPVFDFSGMAVSTSNQGFIVTGASYWDIYGIVIKGAGDNGMLMQNNCGYDKIEFCSFTRNRDAGFQIRSGSHHCLILNCDSYENADLGTGTTTSGGNADGFAPKLDVGDSVVFRGCRSWMNSDDGWDGYLKTAGTSYPQLMTTILEDCWSFRNGYYWLDGSTNTSMNGNGIKMGGSANKDEAHNFVVKRCLSFYNKAKGFDQNNNAGSMWLYNNTAYHNGDVDYGLNSSGVTYATGAVTVVVNSTCTSGHGATFKSGSTLTTNNFTAATTNFLSFDTTGVSQPRGLDGALPTLNFMRLSANSTLIDAGTKEPNIPYHDSLGIPFYGTTLDIGAFELPKATNYTFVDDGNWTAQSKWQDHNIPPDSMFTGSGIIIDPLITGQCYLNKAYHVAPGCTLTVAQDKLFFIPSFLLIND